MIFWILDEITPASQLIIEPFLAVATILFLSTVAVVLLYYDRIRRASKAYEESRNIVSDIVVSFDRQIQRQDEQMATTAQSLEALAAKSERLEEGFRQQESQLNRDLTDLKSKITHSPDFEDLRNRVQDVSKQLEELVKTQEELKQRPMAPTDLQIETAIPIKRERALAPLTDTELQVLEFIAVDGEKTAPQIKDMIRLTREHTARLMKKLYEEGYLERRSEKAPYAYRVKEEMLRILRKNEAV